MKLQKATSLQIITLHVSPQGLLWGVRFQLQEHMIPPIPIVLKAQETFKYGENIVRFLPRTSIFHSSKGKGVTCSSHWCTWHLYPQNVKAPICWSMVSVKPHSQYLSGKQIPSDMFFEKQTGKFWIADKICPTSSPFHTMLFQNEPAQCLQESCSSSAMIYMY